MRLRQYVVTNRLDLFEYPAVDPTQGPESGLTVDADELKQWCGFRVILPGSIRFESHELNKCRAGDRAPQITFGAAKAVQVFLRKVDSSHREIFGYIPQDIRELKGGSEFWCEFQRFCILKAEHVDTA